MVRKLYRERISCGRLFISGNFGDSGEYVLVMSLDIDSGGLK